MKIFLKIVFVFIFMLSVKNSVFAQDESITTTLLKSQIEKSKIKNGSHLMLRAIVDNNIDAAKKLLRLGYDPNERFSKIPASFFAIYLKRVEILDMLMDFGADPNAEYFGVTLLDFSIYLNCPKCVSTLAKYGADLNKKTLGETPLNFAIIQKSPEIIKILIDEGAKANKRTCTLLKRKKYEEFAVLFGVRDTSVIP